MSIRVALHHETRYGYDRPVNLSPHVVRLRPAPHCRTPIVSHSLRIQPAEHFINWQQDPFGNYQARLVFTKPASELVVEVDLVVDMTVINPFDFFLEKEAEHFPFAYAPALKHDLLPYLQTAPLTPLFSEFVEHARSRFATSGRRVIDVLVDLNRHVQKALRYDIRMEPGVFAPEETLERGHGSCRDFAWLLVQTLRQVGFAARFVSGYSIQLKADEKPLRGSAGVSADLVDLHAWAEVFLPGAGWVGFDATSGLLAGEGHIPLACTPDPETAAAVTGSFSWHKRSEHDRVTETFAYRMSVRRVLEAPRVTLPYTDDQWNAIESLGRSIDRKLTAGDVRLTMGGEPTFVADADPEAPEWTIDALGPTKRRYATELLRRLYQQFTPNGLIHEGQGKWYPGEPLPRWALSSYFRKDGDAIWQNPELFSRAETGSATAKDAHAFVSDLAERLGVESRFALPAFEDTWYYLWRERRLPVNTDPHDSRLENEAERARLAKIFEQGLKAIIGYALPLRRAKAASAKAWQSGEWFLRRERMYLMPGDSPMGYRLPLDSLPWAVPGESPELYPADPFAGRAELPRRERLAAVVTHQANRTAAAREEATPPERFKSDPTVVRTALCVEPRNGVIHVFMPPLETVEDYLGLCAAIESTAEALGQPVRIEGYHPPSDPRIGRLQVTPDPGVLEVNVQPASSWDELVRNTTILYEEARQTELRAEKFMMDGRHTGTGGGNHIVLGGPTPADSPLLRRPDLLGSLTSYWLNHPSLSYLFSGLFVGPTSQSPRVDEARNDSVYELEIALEQMRANTDSARAVPYWLVDRLFRNLLVDVTGNTHRAEFCIDKLYTPEGGTGRQGLLELRSFEMPPHAKMSLTQQLLVRALVAWFWHAPYDRSPVRWGTELHDRFMLPHFVEEDFNDVLGDLRRAGIDFDASWFAPHREFRFPALGQIEARTGVVLELRQAIEPWHVMGEEATGAGTSRYVDSSVERLQVKVRGMVGARHVVACNGRRVPLHPTGTNGEYVAAVRYRAWRPPSALHPTIGIHTPLVFDVVDTWNDQAIAGCRYHVAHPGGLAAAVFPRNSFEAEGRRASRFWAFGHTPGPHRPPPVELNPEFPFTLDLRR
ncbi:MAG: transglutaminase family protein [Polyangiaceae bacterium]